MAQGRRERCLMQRNRTRAAADFRRMILWIMGIGVLMVIGALWYISLYEPLRLHMVVATVAGVFFSVLLGCGLFAAAFYSDKSGHDDDVTNATRQDD
jgi:polyferredoxin